MQILNKIEDFLNKCIYAMITFLIKVIPPQLKTLEKKLEIKALTYKEKIAQKVIHSKEEILHRAHDAQIKVKNHADHLKENITHKKENFQKKIVGMKEAGFKGFLQSLSSFAVSIQNWFTHLSPNQIIGGALGFLVLSIGIILLLSKNRQIGGSNFSPHEVTLGQSPSGQRIIISKPDNMDRPNYHKINQKQMLLEGLHFPVFGTHQPKPRFFGVDLIIEMSNRYSIQFLKNYETEFRDHVLNNIHPIVPIFPLTPEGKEVIRTKMRIEVESFLKKNNIEAEVLDVHILSVMAT